MPYYKSCLLLTYLLLISLLSTGTAANVELVKSYPHDARFFTQGFIIDQQMITETTGQYGKSGLYQYKLNDTKPPKKLALEDYYFGEGLSLHNNTLYWLTWKAGRAYVITPESWAIEKLLPYKGEGWGLTSNNKHLIMSNGSHILQFKNPETFKTEKTLSIFYKQKPLKNLNELEWVNGYILANIWRQDNIAKIDPDSGKVLAMYSLGFLRKLMDVNNAGVLNGIAYDKTENKLYVTGKNWPALFEIKLPN